MAGARRPGSSPGSANTAPQLPIRWRGKRPSGARLTMHRRLMVIRATSISVVGDAGSCEIEVTRAGFKTVAGPGRNSPTPVPRQRHVSREWLRACGVGHPVTATRESFEPADHHPGARGGAPRFEPRAVSCRHGFSARGRSGAATGRTRATGRATVAARMPPIGWMSGCGKVSDGTAARAQTCRRCAGQAADSRVGDRRNRKSDTTR